MQRVVPRLRNVNWGVLSVFLPISILAVVLVLRYFFEIYIILNLIQVVGLFKRVIPVVGVVGIVLGAVGFLNKARPQSKAFRIFSLIGILLNIALVYSAYRIELPTVKGTITDVYIYENEPQLSLFVDLPTIKFDKNFFGNPSEPILVVHITNETTIYEQVGNWSWQKKIISADQLQVNQYVEVKYDGSILINNPGQIYAAEIIVVKKPNWSSHPIKTHPTQRAADNWDSARFQAVFNTSAGFRFRAFVSARPVAANANRWAHPLRHRRIVLCESFG